MRQACLNFALPSYASCRQYKSLAGETLNRAGNRLICQRPSAVLLYHRSINCSARDWSDYGVHHATLPPWGAVAEMTPSVVPVLQKSSMSGRLKAEGASCWLSRSVQLGRSTCGAYPKAGFYAQDESLASFSTAPTLAGTSRGGAKSTNRALSMIERGRETALGRWQIKTVARSIQSFTGPDSWYWRQARVGGVRKFQAAASFAQERDTRLTGLPREVAIEGRPVLLPSKTLISRCVGFSGVSGEPAPRCGKAREEANGWGRLRLVEPSSRVAYRLRIAYQDVNGPVCRAPCFLPSHLLHLVTMQGSRLSLLSITLRVWIRNQSSVILGTFMH